MNTRTDKILGASLALAAFSFITPSQVQAQTCVTPPTCDSLGYNKTTADCEGKTILKCPFDTSQVYCPGADEQGDSPFVSTWEVGSSVMYNGEEIGVIYQDNGASVSVYDRKAINAFYCRHARDACLERTTYANMAAWHLPYDATTAQKLAKLLNLSLFYSGSECDNYGGFCNKDSCGSSYDQSYVCVAEIPAPVNR